MLVNNTLRRALAIALAIAAGPASALGLGQIQVKSHPGQPLLAEIPIISSDPAELQGLQVQLASPETFQRIGLEAPQGDVSQLHFEPAIDADGRPVIRITSPAPVQQPLLTFLLEVDWSGGRLVREYSALVDTPRTVAAPAQPPIEAPTVATPNTIVAPTPAPPAATVAPAAAARPTATPAASRPPPAQATPVPQRAVAAAPVQHPASPPGPAPATPGDYRVRGGDTLAKIASGMDAGGTLDQAMLALLRANPQAFVDGNINRLKSGAVLRTPTAEELSRIGAGEAAALVHEQIAGWRQARKPLVQPAGNALASASSSSPRPAAKSAPPVRSDARLEIAPPTSANAKQAGTRSGLEAGGEGEMLRQQLQETKETLAARDVEVQELKSRVAELEKIQQDQQQLIQMKSSALAAAQHDLARSNNAAATPPAPAAAAATQARVQTAQPDAGQHAAGAWLWSGLALVAVALLGWLATRRRFAAPKPAAARRFDSAALAATVPAPASAPKAPSPAPVVVAPKAAASDMAATLPEARRSATAATTAPSWHNGDGAAVDALADERPAAPSMAADVADESDSPRSAAEQLDLAQAYLDVGDEDAARTLLREVLDSRDPAAREAAARLLREL